MPTFEVTAPRRPGVSSRSLAARCRRKFLRFFPRGFRDETYLSRERGYKYHAHEQREAELGRDTLGALLHGGRHAEAATRAVRIESRTNRLFSFETMALRDAVNTAPGAKAFSTALYDLLHSGGQPERKFNDRCNAVANLPRRQTRVLTRPLLTVFGFIARPKRHVFLKPNVTGAAADASGFPSRYESRPDYATHDSLLAFARTIRRDLRDLRLPRQDRPPVVHVGTGF